MGALGTLIQIIDRLFLRNPKLKVRIGEVRASADLPNATSRLPHPTTFSNCSLELRRWRKVYRGSRQSIDIDDLRLLSPPPALGEVIGHSMPDYGREFEGWLCFTVPDMLVAELHVRERLVLTIIDSLGNSHKFKGLTSNPIHAKFLSEQCR
jgi:hypothetical protein